MDLGKLRMKPPKDMEIVTALKIVSSQGKSTKHAGSKSRGHERRSSGQVKHFLTQREDEFEAVSLTARVSTAEKHRREGLGTMVFHQTSKRR